VAVISRSERGNESVAIAGMGDPAVVRAKFIWLMILPHVRCPIARSTLFSTSLHPA
jgi:hypothetical protein